MEMPFEIKTIESPSHKIKMKVNLSSQYFVALPVIQISSTCNVYCDQKTATMATVELCSGSGLGTGFQLYIGLAEIHVPRMWVEESTSGPNVGILPVHWSVVYVSHDM